MTEIALVTGGAGGIGRAICRRLVQAGYAVVAGDVTVGPGPGDPRPAQPGDVIDQVLDVQSLESIEAAFAFAARLGRLTAVVNCAGNPAGHPGLEPAGRDGPRCLVG